MDRHNSPYREFFKGLLFVLAAHVLGSGEGCRGYGTASHNAWQDADAGSKRSGLDCIRPDEGGGRAAHGNTEQRC